MADTVVTAADVLLGPIALLLNYLQHGFPPQSNAGLAELIASSLGTAMWASIAGTVARFAQ